MSIVLSQKVLYRLAEEGKKVVQPVVENADNKCSECDFVAKNKIGLIAHMRKHEKKDQTEVTE